MKNRNIETKLKFAGGLCFIIMMVIFGIMYKNHRNTGIYEEIESKYQNRYCAYCGKELRICGMPPDWYNFVCSDTCKEHVEVGNVFRTGCVGVVTCYDEKNWFITALEFYPESEIGDHIKINANIAETMLSLNKIRTIFSNTRTFSIDKTIQLNSYITGTINLICGIDDNGKYLKYILNDIDAFKLYEYQILDVLKEVVKKYNMCFNSSNSNNHNGPDFNITQMHYKHNVQRTMYRTLKIW